jgi:hypothetical protein
MGDRPFPELPRSKQLAVLYRDTKRLRWLVEQKVGAQVDDAEWLRTLGTIDKQLADRITASRKHRDLREMDQVLKTGVY